MNTHHHLVFLACFIISTACTGAPDKTIICNQDYALCTSASCIPDPRHAEYAICVCDVEQGESIGYTTCDIRRPHPIAFQVKKITSTFSFKQFSSKKSLTCPPGRPWTDCIDAPCTVDPMHADKAICSCKINHDQSFVTFGGNCDTNTCSTGFWSGAMISSSQALREALLKHLDLSDNPWINIHCPVSKTH